MTLPLPAFLAVAAGDHLGMIAIVVIALAGLAMGWSDVSRFRFSRIWALSSNCFTESMRRRVLLVVPLAIAGVIVVVQLQQATDEQDAIRQTLKFTLFTSGLLVTVTALILSCTSLPREIENRVIYTVVTKPTTRLEIVLGKVIGFARVSGLILLLMGVFIFCYLELRNWRMMRAVREQLTAEPDNSPRRPTLQHYAQNGFLTTKSLSLADDLHVYSRAPKATDTVRWMRGGENHYCLLEFDPTEAERDALVTASEKGATVQLIANLQIVRHIPTPAEERAIKQYNLTPEKPKQLPHLLGPELPAPATTAPAGEIPSQVKIRVLDENQRELVPAQDIDGGASGILIRPQTQNAPGAVVTLPPAALQSFSRVAKFYVEVGAVTPSIEFGAAKDAVVLLVTLPDGQGFYVRPDPAHGAPEFFARVGQRGIVLIGSPTGDRSVAVYRFHGVDIGRAVNGKLTFQLDAVVDKTGEFETGATFAQVTLEVLNDKTGESSGPITVTPELNRTTLFDVPESAVAGGNFEVRVRDLTPEQWLGIGLPSVALVTGNHLFAVNLFKSMLLLWLLSTLVVVISVFCSTFLSWPIAIVLTIVMLVSHWGVQELGDALNAGVGRGVTTELGVRDATSARIVSTSVEGLTRFLKTISIVLPDISQYPASEDIERGANIPLNKIGGALQVSLVYGIVLVIGAYLILRYKEVAP